MEFGDLVSMIAVSAVPVIFAITLHEAAHGYVAGRLGDKTATMLGRVSLNPARHIDWVGTILLPLVMLFVSSGRLMFGWAKPVPVNFDALRNPKRDMFWVALAGPTANLLMAVAWAAALKVAALAGLGNDDFLAEVPRVGVGVNLVFMALNLLPILPLDGGRIVVSLLPKPIAWRFSRLEPYGLPILLGLVFISSYGYNILGLLLYPIMYASKSVIEAIFQVYLI
jgi:Zn-dependent protease